MAATAEGRYPHKHAVVLFSGGQDSTTCLFWAKRELGDVHALSFDYGQRHRSELEAAREIANLAGVASHETLKLGVLAQLADSSLVSTSGELTSAGGYDDDQVEGGLPSSFVPGRNLLFLGVAAAYAVKRGIKDIVVGVSQEDYSGYPDCRPAFVETMREAVNQAMPSSSGPLVIHTPLMDMSKAEEVELARELGDDCWAALARSITCYQGQRPGCGDCPSCQLRAGGFELAGQEDPARAYQAELQNALESALVDDVLCPECGVLEGWVHELDCTLSSVNRARIQPKMKPR